MSIKTPEQIAASVLDGLDYGSDDAERNARRAVEGFRSGWLDEGALLSLITGAIEADRAQRIVPNPLASDQRLIRDDLERVAVTTLEAELSRDGLDLSDGMASLTINTDRLVRIVQAVARAENVRS